MQIAVDLQIAESTVKSRLHHALRVLRLHSEPSPPAAHCDPPVS